MNIDKKLNTYKNLSKRSDEYLTKYIEEELCCGELRYLYELIYQLLLENKKLKTKINKGAK